MPNPLLIPAADIGLGQRLGRLSFLVFRKGHISYFYRTRGLVFWQSDAKRGSSALGILDTDFPLMKLDYFFADIQTQADSRIGFAGPEFIKNDFFERIRNAFAVIGYLDEDILIALFRLQDHPAFGGDKFMRIGQ